MGDLIADMAETSRRLPVIQPGESSTEPPVFEKVAIIGLGLVGGSIALAARERWPGGLVIGVDRKDVLELAMVRHAIDVAADDPVVVAEAELVILAAPVRQNLELLAALDDHVPGSAIVTDVGSTKREIVARAQSLPRRFTFVGGHPLGGAPRGGLGNARPDLFVDRPWLFTPTSDADAPALERLQQFVAGLGARPHLMSPAQHDRLLAFLSHIPQLTASALMHVVGTAAGADRLASSPVSVWRDICASNADELGLALDTLIAELRQLREQLETGGAVDRVFESAAAWRAVLAERGGGRRPGS